MSEEIAAACRKYVSEMAPYLDGQPEDAAVAALVIGLRNHGNSLGWEPLYFHVNVEFIAREELKKYRSQIKASALKKTAARN